MTFFTDLETRAAAVRALLPGDVTVSGLGAATAELSDDELLVLAQEAANARQLWDQVTLAASARISERSSHESGPAGLARSRGFRSPTALVQQLTGVSRGFAIQQIRVGGALLETEAALDVPRADDAQASEARGVSAPSLLQELPWHAPLGSALLAGILTAAQHDAIARGLGEPPVPGSEAGVGGEAAKPTPEIIAAWAEAAGHLVSYASECTVEELAKHAREVRDLLDPAGAAMRSQTRYEKRSFRTWTDEAGQHHGRFVFDDEGAEWVRTMIDTALRPRRGGPRFFTAEERADADQLMRDPRSNDQLGYDLIMDVLRAGAIADAKTVFGVRQAGIKLVQFVNRAEYLVEQQTERVARMTRFQESGTITRMSAGEKQQCNTGVQTVVVDESGNPLDVGREHRLFTSKQRIALAIRDGGCRWPGCDRPASYCEAHHIDHWEADAGRTDIDRGVLLCQFHHLHLHNSGRRITREGLGPFLLHEPSVAQTKPNLTVVGRALPRPDRPSGQNGPVAEPRAAAPRELRPPLPLRYLWQQATAPPRRFRIAA